MQLGLEGKVVLVTGGTKGIGRAIVEGFLEEGAIVHFCSRTAADVEAAQQQLSAAYPKAKVVGATADVSNQDDLDSWVKMAAAESGGVDVVVSNVSALVIDNTAANWQACFKVDVLGTFGLVKAAQPYLETSRGNIVAISSVSGRDVDFSAPSPYGSMKAAVTHYMAQLAHTLAPKGVRANTVSPGNVYDKDGIWGQVERNSPDLFRQQMALNPSGRFGTPKEVADAVVFLASQRAARISGTDLLVDGALCTGVQF